MGIGMGSVVDVWCLVYYLADTMSCEWFDDFVAFVVNIVVDVLAIAMYGLAWLEQWQAFIQC